METIFSHIGHWHWIAFGVVMVALEVFISGFVLLWFGIAAIIVGILVAIFPGMPWEWQLVIFSISSVGSIAAWFYFFRNQKDVSDRPELNRKGAQYINRVFTLQEPIVDGIGKIKVDDSSWRVSGEDAEVGTKVKIVGMEATTFIVEKVE